MLPVALFFGLSIFIFGGYYWVKNDLYPHHVQALPLPPKKCTGAIPKIRTTMSQAEEPMQITPQDQQAYIAISVKAGVPFYQVNEMHILISI